jgi:hypothetical protein
MIALGRPAIERVGLRIPQTFTLRHFAVPMMTTSCRLTTAAGRTIILAQSGHATDNETRLR